MKKKLLILGLLSISFVLASCGTKSVEDKDNGNSNTSQDTGGEGEQKPDEGGEQKPDGGDTDPAKEYVNISIYEGTVNNKTLVEVQKVEKGSLIKENLTEPKKDGYNFIEFLYYSPQGVLIPDTVFSKLTASIDLNVFATFDKIDYNSVYNTTKETSNLSGTNYLNLGTEEQQANFYQGGFVEGKIPDFSQYKNTSEYVKVSNASEFITALTNARLDYTSEVDEIIGTSGKIVRQNVRQNSTNWTRALDKGLYLKNDDGSFTKIPVDTPWDPEDAYYTADKVYYEDSNYVDVSLKQNLVKNSTVHVIEITEDIDLGYYKLSESIKNSGIVKSFCEGFDNDILNDTAEFTSSSMLKEHGMSQITISKTNNLLIYSKNGAKITHAGFKVESSDRVVFRNLEMDELWQWEDSANPNASKTIGDMDVYGWAYFKISYNGYIWIDHCTFGKSYDGQIDVSNPYFYYIDTADRAPYGVPTTYDENNYGGVHISNCKFQSGSDDPNGYIYKMMEEVEADYQKSITDTTYTCKYSYYQKLRNNYKLSFEEILYGIAIPQKKGFLLGDSKESKESYSHRGNLTLKVSFANDVFIDIEDRLPNVRGGLVYMYNSLVDNSRYYKYRQLLLSKGVQNISSFGNYKLALVSQGILGGYEGSIAAENCIFIGIDTLVKNNNTDKGDITNDQMVAGYKLLDCIWYNDKNSTDVERIINTDTNPDIIKSTVEQKSPMDTTYFSWHNESNTKPFETTVYDISNLTSLLIESQAVGVNAHYEDLYLITSKN